MSAKTSPQAALPDLATLLRALQAEVPFTGWSAQSLKAAAQALDLSPADLHRLAPEGAAGLAFADYAEGDATMTKALAAQPPPPPGSRRPALRARVAEALRLRLAATDKARMRQSLILFAQAPYARRGAAALWGTADAIWRALGDESQGTTAFTKRLSLSAIYSATLLYWLGDDSPESAASWAFLDRRLDDLMRFEKAKAALPAPPPLPFQRFVNLEALFSPLTRHAAPPRDLPGYWPGPAKAEGEL